MNVTSQVSSGGVHDSRAKKYEYVSVRFMEDLKAARECASEADDSETEDLMIARIQKRFGC